jgi:CheY-like chemotaxis protein/anti-sigma regulatory factor (Ser/Thr protein kinase)
VELAPTRLYVNADELRLSQALTNLLNNAARYTHRAGHIRVKVTLGQHEEHQWVCIGVSDNGRGIEPNLLNSVFAMFVQGKDPLNRPSSGLGVGLALARAIVELHHGTLEAKSAGVGRGAEFIIRLPLAAVLEPKLPDVAKEGELRESTPAVHAPSCRILVVDDNVDAAVMLSSLLERHGHEVVSVYDGTDALRAFDGFRPDIVLLDIGMPGMNGLEVARRLRERRTDPRPFIVAVTGWGKPEDEARSREAGFDVHLVKPVEEDNLLQVIDTRDRVIH